MSVGLLAVRLLAAHGASYLTLKTEGPMHDRSRHYARILWAAFVPLLLVVSIETWITRPELPTQAMANPFAWLSFLVTICAAGTVAIGLSRDREMQTFLGANLLIAGMLATGAATIYSTVLYSTVAPQNSLTVQAATRHLIMASIWWPVAFLLAATYFIFLSRHYNGKVSVKRDTQGFY